MSLLNGLDSQQIGWMKHALGLTKKSKPWRNYFYCTGKNEKWEEMVDKGIATKRQGWESESVVYFVTYEAALELYGKRMSKKYFSEI